MTLPKLSSVSTLSAAGVVLLVGGLGIAIFASQQQQDPRSKAAEAGSMTCHIVSDTSTKISGGGNAVAAKVYSGWTSISYSTWIWNAYETANPTVQEDVLFLKDFYVSLPVTSFDIDIAADNSYEVGVNGSYPFSRVNAWSSVERHFFNPADFKEGLNTLNVKGRNYASQQSGNPAGVIYKFSVTAKYCHETKPPPQPPSEEPSQEPSQSPQPLQTKFDLNLLLHGIGQGGDNRNPNGGGNPNPLHPTRSVVVDVLDFDDNVIVSNKQGQVTYDPVSGSYKGQVEMGTALTSQAYTIKVKLSHSLRASISRNITAGTTNVIPRVTLVNGDANNDARLDIADYNIIQGCYSDFDLPPVDCDATRKTQADIDDDGKVNQFDLNLFLREMSVQQL